MTDDVIHSTQYYIKYINNNKFRFKSEFKSQAHICKFAAPWAKNNPETTRRFRELFRGSLNLRL